MQSGDDTPLKNIWDEVCVQVQGQESVLWEDGYVPTIKSLIIERLENESPETKQAIWLQTDAGTELDGDEQGDAPVDDDAIADYILDRYVLSAAADWTNSRLEQYNTESSEQD